MQDLPPSGSASPAARLLGLTLLMFVVGFFVCGVFLLTTCQTTTIVGQFSTTVGCSYPFQGYGLAFLYSAALASILAANLLVRSLQSVRPSREVIQDWYVRSFFALIGVTVLFLFALLVLGVA